MTSNRADLSNEELRADPGLQASYGELFDLYPDHPVELNQGILRWVASPMAKWIEGHVDLQAMHVAFIKGTFSIEDYARFMRETGWSLSSFWGSAGPHLKLSGVNSYEELTSALKGQQ